MSEQDKRQSYILILAGGLIAVMFLSVTFPMVWSDLQIPENPDNRPQYNSGDSIGMVHWVIITDYVDGSSDVFETEPELITIPLQLVKDEKEVKSIHYELRWAMVDGIEVSSYVAHMDAYMSNNKIIPESSFNGDYPRFTFQGGVFSDDFFTTTVFGTDVVAGQSYVIVNSADQGKICTVPYVEFEQWGVPCLETSNQFNAEENLIPISESTITLRVDGFISLVIFDSGNNVYTATTQMTTVNYDMIYVPDPQTVIASQPYVSVQYQNNVNIQSSTTTGEICNPVCGPMWDDLGAKRTHDYYHVNSQVWNPTLDGDCGVANEKCNVVSVSYIAPNCTNSPARGEECISDGSHRSVSTAVKVSVCDDVTKINCENNNFLCDYIDEVDSRGFTYTGNKAHC